MKHKNSIKIQGGSLSKSFILEHESEKAFLESMSDKTHATIMAGDKNREAKLKELYASVVPKKEAPAKGK